MYDFLWDELDVYLMDRDSLACTNEYLMKVLNDEVFVVNRKNISEPPLVKKRVTVL